MLPATTTKSTVTTKAASTIVPVVTTKSTTKAPSGIFVCPGDGLYKNPADCSKYYSCAGGVAYVMPCSSGLQFNAVQKYCDWPANVVC